ncbi:uncharacterized protein LOC115766316 isoform X1 [Drosophila novamexicana]|nr:uncharacterized protein LOC115766316 isoform X1 [Drosophila novamexicana]
MKLNIYRILVFLNKAESIQSRLVCIFESIRDLFEVHPRIEQTHRKLSAFSIACLVLHFYSFNDRDIMTSFMATGTFTGYIIVVIGVFAGVLMRAPIHKRIDIFFSVLGCALFVASGVFIIEAWEFSFRTRTRDLALIKASLSIVNGVLFGFDAIFTFRDK